MGRVLTRDSSWSNTLAVCVWVPASRGTQDMPMPRTCFKHLNPTSPQPGCKSTSKSRRDTYALNLPEGVLEERVPGAQKTPTHPLCACCGCVLLNSPSAQRQRLPVWSLAALTCSSLRAAPRDRRGFGVLVLTSDGTATLRLSSSLWLSSPWGCIVWGP